MPAERGRISPNQALAAIPQSWGPSLRLKDPAAIAEIGLCRRIRSDNGQRSPDEVIKFRTMGDRAAVERSPASGLYHGWLVVAAAFLVALFGFGLGFYGPGIYLVALKARHGWSIGQLSSVITTYYVLGASLLFFGVGSLFELYGARKVLTVGIVAMSKGWFCLRGSLGSGRFIRHSR